MTTTNSHDFSETAPPPPARSGGSKHLSIGDETFTSSC